MFNKIVSKNQDTTLKGGSRQHLGYRKGMSIASLNVNSLRRRYDEIKLLLKNLGINVLALNETKLDPEYPKELTTIFGYQHERRDRTGRGEGVSIYIRDSINYIRRNDLPDNQLELICIEIEPPKGRPFFILHRCLVQTSQ